MLDRYVAQVRLLLGVLPDIATETVFALKGGTAINLFYRDMPRLSVDVDLTYLPVADRQSSLEDMDDAFSRIVAAITERNPRVKARRIAGGGDNDTRIMVSDGSAQIKIETSPVTRGAVYPARTMVASEMVTEQFGFVETNVLAFEDLYGGKLHAALDRQHPRDLFDVKFLYENEGLTVGGGQVVLRALGVYGEQLDVVFLRQPVVDDPAAAAFSPSGHCSADLADAASAPDYVASLRMHAQERLPRGVAIVVEMLWQLHRECRCLDEQHDPNYILIA